MRRNRRQVRNRLSIIKMHYLAPQRIAAALIPMLLVAIAIPVVTAISISSTYQSRIHTQISEIAELELKPRATIAFSDDSNVDLAEIIRELKQSDLPSPGYFYQIGSPSSENVMGAATALSAAAAPAWVEVSDEYQACKELKKNLGGVRDVLILASEAKLTRILYLCSSAGLRPVGYAVSSETTTLASPVDTVVNMVGAIGIVLSNSLK